MVKGKLWYGALFLMLFGCLGCSRQAEIVRLPVTQGESAVLTIAGSGSNIELTRHLAAEYFRQAGQKINIPGSIGTSGAIKATQAGAISLGLASRALTEAEKAQGLNQTYYASIGLAVAVDAAVPETDIDMQTLVEIYQREKTAWSNGTHINPLVMYEGDSTNMVLKKEIPGFADALKKALSSKDSQVLYSEGLMLDALTKTPNSIGFVDAVAIAEATGKIRAMKIHGVEMNVANLQTKQYPLKKELYFIYKNPLTIEAKAFIDFCLSDIGRRIIYSSQMAIPPTLESKR